MTTLQGLRQFIVCFFLLATGLGLVLPLSWAEDESSKEDSSISLFSPTHTYEVLFSSHPQESDRLSGVRLLGVTDLGGKPFLKFQVLLNNQLREGLIDLHTVSAIFPTGDALSTKPMLELEQRPVQPERVREVRAETIREVVREAPPETSQKSNAR